MVKNGPRLLWLLAACAATTAGSLQTRIASAAGESVSFSRQVAPILAMRCIACHGAKKPEGDFQLHTFARLMKSGASELPAIVPGKPQESYLVELITSADTDVRMPKEAEPLAAADIALLRRWIAEGAKFDGPDAAAPIESFLQKAPHPRPPRLYPRPVPVTALSFSPDGSLLATSGYHEVLLWNLGLSAAGSAGASSATGSASAATAIARETIQLERRVQNIAQRTHAIAFNGDASLMAVAAGTPGRLGEVKLFDPRSGELVSDLATFGDEVFDVEFTRDGARLAACGADRTIRVYDVSERREVKRIEAHADWVMAVAWNPDGTLLASAGRDKVAKLIDAASGAVLVTYPGHDEQVFDVVFSADGRQVFSAGRGRELHRWTTDGKSTSKSDVRKKETGPIFGRTRGEIHRLLLHGTQVLAASADGKLSEFDPAQDRREPVIAYEGSPPQAFSVALHEPTRRIAVGGFDGRVTMYEIGDVAPWQVFIAAPR